MAILNTVKSLRFRYILGLSTIAILVTASFITMQRVVSEQRNYTSVVNLAGHQAGLSNRIAYFACLMASTTDESEYNMARSQVGRTMNKMRRAHDILRNGSRSEGIPFITSDVLTTIYDDPMVGLDVALENFLKQAKILYDNEKVDLTVNSSAYIYLTTYGPHVLEPLLDAAVDEYEKIGREAIVRIENLELGIWIAAIVILIFEILFIFLPLERHVKRTLSSLEKTISELQSTRKRLISAQKLALVGDWEFFLQDGKITFSDQIYDICGIINHEEKELSVKHALGFIHKDDRFTVWSSLRSLLRREKTHDMEYRVITPDGKEKLVYQYAISDFSGGGECRKIMATVQDITERKELSTRLEKLSEQIPGFIFQFLVSNDGKSWFPYVSKGIESTCGIKPHQVESSSDSMYDIFHPEDIERVKTKIIESSKRLHIWHDQYRIYHPQKGYIWLEGHATPERLIDGGTLWYGYIWDITERKNRENQIRKLALYDPLTGLANRRLLQDRLSHAIATSNRNSNYGAVVILDLDNFKSLNDTKGHDVGDALLVEVAKRLTGCVRESDTISRLGGDEFVVILEWLGVTKNQAKKKAKEVAEKLRVALNRTYFLCDEQYVHHASASIGIAVFQGSSISESELLKRADVAMYEAKDLGRNRFCLYSEQRQAMIDKRSALAHDMKVALDNSEFSLYLQPQISRTGEVCGAEALVRWVPPGKEPISPASFIPIAESTGLILPIGEWVLHKACTYLDELMRLPIPPNFTLAVNISAKQFADVDFIEKVKTILGEKNIPFNRMKFELTESSLVQDLEHTKIILQEFQDMGILIELDDFGTGYSSLNSLNNLPLSTMKIDKSLVHGIEGQKCNEAIVRAAIGMAKAMSLDIIAEGVETVGQSQFLINEGCNALQGFLYGKPMPFNEFIDYLSVQVRQNYQFQGQYKEPPQVSRSPLKPSLVFN